MRHQRNGYLSRAVQGSSEMPDQVIELGWEAHGDTDEKHKNSGEMSRDGVDRASAWSGGKRFRMSVWG